MAQNPVKLQTPLSEDDVRSLRIGDAVKLSGVIYTARDAAHARLIELLEAGKELPFPVEGAVLYYVGPCPAKPPRVIGSAGPTTSYRMDPYTPPLLAAGLRGMIGKGKRGPAVREAMQKHGAVYFAAVGGAAALIARSVKSLEIIAYQDLGTEAVRRLEVEDLPLIVANDAHGGDAYLENRKPYQSLALD
jgi:fumarate hydratase subunit beta